LQVVPDPVHCEGQSAHVGSASSDKAHTQGPVDETPEKMLKMNKKFCQQMILRIFLKVKEWRKKQNVLVKQV
jgi:hypothetical protein